MSQLEIKFGSPLHKRVVEGVVARKRLARNRYADRYTAWEKDEETAIAYIKESSADAARRSLRDGKGIPQYTTLVVPFSQAIYLAALTYWTSVFLGRQPIFQYTSRQGQGQDAVLGLEALIDYQINVGGGQVPLYVWLADVGKYGLGVMGVYWDKEVSRVSEIVEEEETIEGIPTGKKRKVRRTQEVTNYEGNRLFNIRPQDFFPDPRVPITRFQDGEFCGRHLEVGWNTLLQGEANARYFNIANLKDRIKNSRDGARDRGSSQVPIPESQTHDFLNDMGYVNIDEMTIELVPSVWKLGASTLPEKWVFTVADDHVVIGAQPLGELHNKFPYAILSYEINGYSLYNRSMLELAQPLNNVMTWLVNTHFYNVRKAMNDMIIVNPERVEMADLLDPNPGTMIRTKAGFADIDPRTVVTQLKVTDVTQNHLRDLTLMMDLLQRMMGVNDSIMGAVNSGGRKSATEIRTSSTFSINRLKMNAEFMSAVGFQPLAAMLVQSTQQHFDEEMELKIAGNTPGEQKTIKASPESIAGQFDFVSVDGTFPIDRFAQANLWRQIMVDMGSNPELAQRFDIGKVFEHVLQLQGIKNVDSFKVQVVPDAQAKAMAQAGQTTPVPQNRQGSPTQAPLPQQLTGVGPIG